MTTPNPTPPPVRPVATQTVIEYQHAQRAYKAFRVASGGLLLMASFLLLIGAIIGLANISSFSQLSNYTFSEIVLFILTGVLPPVWFVFYFIVALLFRRRTLWAGWTALIMSIVHFGFVFLGFVMSIIGWYRNTFHNQAVYHVLAILVLIAVIIGFGAVIYEVWVAVRTPIVWLRADAPPPPAPPQ